LPIFPSYQLLYYTPEKTYRYKVVVGKTSTPTPMLESILSHIETAPDWKIPNKIFINEMLPKAIKNNTYFENNHIAVYDQKESFVAINGKSLAQIKLNPTKYHARQTAGCDNALGTVVFRFNNPHSIYLHDTPEKQYFNRPKRALSHGCIRVESAEKLAALLLEQDGQAGVIPSLKKAISSYSKKNFLIKNQVPIIITYLTATIEEGLLVKHEDIYKLDKQLKSSQK
ncbi:MAG: L,D-transpeptidase family protein, partial [Bacteroidia bacterium]